MRWWSPIVGRENFRRDVRLRFVRLINVFVENAKTTHGKRCVQFHGHPIRAHDVRLGRTELRLLAGRLRLAELLVGRHNLLHYAGIDALTLVMLRNDALRVSVRVDGDVELAAGAQFVLIDGHVFDGVNAG